MQRKVKKPNSQIQHNIDRETKLFLHVFDRSDSGVVTSVSLMWIVISHDKIKRDINLSMIEE